MVHFFGVLRPDFGPRVSSPEAPLKARFFGGDALDDTADWRPSVAEQDAQYLKGKLPEPAERCPDAAGERFVTLCLPPYF